MNFEKYLQESEYINFSDPKISSLAKELSKDCKDDEAIAKKCFLYVRDEIKHIGDHKLDCKSIKASEVLENKAGWCYAKAQLLAALLRINNIPTAICYQSLHCNEYRDGTSCLHGLNAIYLKKHGWYRVDPRGNKEGVDAKFCPPKEQLAFILEDGEYDLANIFCKPHENVLKALQTNTTYNTMVGHFPMVEEFVCLLTKKDAKRLSELSISLLPFIFDTEVPTWFEKEFEKEEFVERISDPNYQHFGYVIDNKIVGYITIKDSKHLYHLFVDLAYQKKGIAKKLWEFVKENLEFESITTNSSLNAIKAYESFGFEKEGESQIYNEMLHYQPMRYLK